VEEFIITGVLPELLGKWFTVPHLSSSAHPEKAPEGCSCGNPVDDTDILSCTSEQCKRKRFHKSCLCAKELEVCRMQKANKQEMKLAKQGSFICIAHQQHE